MSSVLIGVLVAGAVGVAGFLVKRMLGSDADSSIDVGAVSESWLSEQRAGKREDRYTS